MTAADHTPSPATDGLREAVEALADEARSRKAAYPSHPHWSAWDHYESDLRDALAAHPAADRDEHHPNCYQSTGNIPDDLPADLCDCRVLRMIDAHKDKDE